MLDIFIASLVLYPTSTPLLVLLFYSLFSSINCICSHIFQYFLLLLATSNFLLPTLLFLIFFYILLLVYYNATRLFLLLTPYFFSIYTFSFFNTKFSLIYHSSSYNILTPIFFIPSTTLITFLFLFLDIFIFSIIFTSSSFITTLPKL